MKLPEHKEMLDYLKMGFGYLVLIMLFFLAWQIAVQKVEAATSYGLESIVTGLFTLGGGFAHWAFGKGYAPKDDKISETDQK